MQWQIVAFQKQFTNLMSSIFRCVWRAVHLSKIYILFIKIQFLGKTIWFPPLFKICITNYENKKLSKHFFWYMKYKILIYNSHRLFHPKFNHLFFTSNRELFIFNQSTFTYIFFSFNRLIYIFFFFN